MKKLTTVLLAALFLGLSVHAGLNEVKKQMADRLGQINKLKEALIIGEDNQGYLAVRTADKISAEDKKVVNAENADRKYVYETLAAKTGTTVEKVQTRRAAAIADKSKAGLWLQKPDGTWYKK